MIPRQINFYVFDEDVKCVGIVDQYISLVWSDRYDECGEFELEVPYTKNYKELLKQNYYCTVDYTNRFAIIEKIEMNNEEGSAPKMIISGRSLECILERRVIVSNTEFGSDEEDFPLQDAVESILTDSFIDPEESERRVDNFVFDRSNDPDILSLFISETYNGDNVYDAISGICQDNHIGFKIVFDINNNFVFSLYKAKDNSENVIFSQHYDNLKSSSYFSSIEKYKNVMYVSSGKDDSRMYTNMDEIPTGLQRCEIHEDESSLKENEKAELTEDQIRVKAVKKLNNEYKILTGFEGDVIPEVVYTYIKDYNVGDKVTLEDLYDNSEVVYISEVAITYDDDGLSIIPTFEEMDWYEEDENFYEEE